MGRIKIDLPGHYQFVTDIPVRITDLNYGGHVGNDTILSIIHEARVRFFVSEGFTELDAGGVGMIMSDVVIQFRNELFYGDTIRISVTAEGFSKVAFDVFYLLETVKAEKTTIIAAAKTGMICYDYKLKKIAAIPENFRSAFSR